MGITDSDNLDSLLHSRFDPLPIPSFSHMPRHNVSFFFYFRMSQHRHGCLQAWAKGGTCLLQMLKVFCAIVVSQTLIRPIIYAVFYCIFTIFRQQPIFCWTREIWRVEVVHLVGLVLVCVLKKGRQLFFRKKCTYPEKNPGYAYEFAHTWKKSFGARTPMNIGPYTRTCQFQRYPWGVEKVIALTSIWPTQLILIPITSYRTSTH